jgi:hypothetical protein
VIRGRISRKKASSSTLPWIVLGSSSCEKFALSTSC